MISAPNCRNCGQAYAFHKWRSNRKGDVAECKHPRDPQKPTMYEADEPKAVA